MKQTGTVRSVQSGVWRREAKENPEAFEGGGFRGVLFKGSSILLSAGVNVIIRNLNSRDSTLWRSLLFG